MRPEAIGPVPDPEPPGPPNRPARQLKIGTKLQIALTLLFVVIAVGNYLILQHFVQAESLRVDEAHIRDDVERCQAALAREITHLSAYARDWASRDDTYDFMANRDPQFAKSNLTDAAFKTRGLHVLCLLTPDNEIVWADAREPDFETALSIHELPISSMSLNTLPDEPSPIAFDHQRTVVFAHEGRPLVLCSRSILRSDSTGPSRGTLIMGRIVADDVLSSLLTQTRVSFAVHPLGEATSADRVRGITSNLPTPDSIFVRSGADGALEAYGYLETGSDDWKPTFVVEVKRKLRGQAAFVARFSMFILATAAVITGAILFLLLRFLVLGPLERMTRQAVRIGATGDLTQRLRISDRSDEIGVLAREFDRMIAGLGEARAKLVETSRSAGMTDAAIGVLHNIGNVLNSVNVSTMSLTEQVRQSKITGLARACDLLEKNRGNLTDFLTNDPRGVRLPEYLSQLSDVLQEEQNSAIRELGHLKTSIDHMNQVVQSQSAFATKAVHREPTDLRQLVTDAITILEAGLKRHGIEITTDLSPMPIVSIDAGKCLQLIINLITNAKDALGDTPRGQKKIRVDLVLSEREHALIRVSDTGIGISAENLTQIFRSGFTTKANGRGFGLHYSALAAREMGGSLSAASDGTGRGAQFTLELPLVCVEEVTA